MGKLGISIYPEKSTENEILVYIKKASEQGFSRIFSCLLSLPEEVDKAEQSIKKIKSICSFAKQKGFEIILDVTPDVFKKLGVSHDDLSFFKDSLHAAGIRLDSGYGGAQEALMTFNNQGLKIELNMSNNTHYLDTIMDFQPNKEKLVGCHNFYPHRFSGITLEQYTKCTDRFNKYGLTTAAFVTSQNDNTFGPWPVTDGLPTLEMHRNLPIDVQAKHFISMGNINDIIISNCYPTDEELKSLGSMRRDMVTFDINLVDGVSEIEKKIIFEELHFNRGDVSSNMIRSTMPRVKFKGERFELFNAPDVIRRGDIVIESSEYGSYAGELQIATCDMKNSGKSNVVGRIREEEIFIIDYIKPWQKFNFKLAR